MKYKLNDKSMIFKYISLNLQNSFMYELNVSDTYTLELAKCIYLYLKETYPRLTKINHETETDIEFEGIEEVYVKFLNYIKIYKDVTIRKNTNQIHVSKRIYDRNSIISNIECIPNSEHFIIKCSISNSISIEERYYNSTYESWESDKSNATQYSDKVSAYASFFNSVNEYNICEWELTDEITQYLMDDSVITDLSSLEDIATIQELLRNSINEYYEYRIGTWDDTMTKSFIEIQNSLKPKNEHIIASGYFDLQVEKYLRSLKDVRSVKY